MKKKETDHTIFYVDPMGFNNLSQYDVSLLSHIECNIHYYTSVKFEYDFSKVTTHKIYSYSNKTGLKKLLSYSKSQLSLLRQIFKIRPKVIHFQWLKLPYLDYLLLALCKRKGIKVVFTAHNLLPHETGNKYRWIFKKLYHLVDVIIVHSNHTKKELSQEFRIKASKIKTVPHGLLEIAKVDREKTKLIKKKMTEDLGLAAKTVFCFLGGLRYYKGLDLVIQAWNQIHDENMHLIIAGSGGEEHLAHLIKKPNVSLYNRFLSNEEFEAFMQLGDYMLLPYRQISQSGVLLSAISKRKRVIVSNTGGLTDPFEFGDIGVILKTLDVESIINAICLAKEKSLNTIDDKIWENIDANYDWRKIGEQTQAIYSNAITNKF